MFFKRRDRQQCAAVDFRRDLMTRFSLYSLDVCFSSRPTERQIDHEKSAGEEEDAGRGY